MQVFIQLYNIAPFPHQYREMGRRRYTLNHPVCVCVCVYYAETAISLMNVISRLPKSKQSFIGFWMDAQISIN